MLRCDHYFSVWVCVGLFGVGPSFCLERQKEPEAWIGDYQGGVFIMSGCDRRADVRSWRAG